VETGRVAACLIVRDGLQTIGRLLESITPFVDEVAVYDTGSRDGTVDFLESRSGGTGIRVERGTWVDDFAWAREQSFALASPDVSWLMWLDADDVVQGGEALRELVANAPADLGGYAAAYECARDADGHVVESVWRVRLVRRSTGFRWVGVVHEGLVAPTPDVRLARVPPEVFRVLHQPVLNEPDTDRNLRILLAAERRALDSGEGLDRRSMLNLGLELFGRGRFDEAITQLEAYTAGCGKAPVDECSDAVHKLGASLRIAGRLDDALALELAAAETRPDWSPHALGVAECLAALARWREAENWASRAARAGVPETAILINPFWLTLAPQLRLAEARLELGRPNDAAAALAEAIAVAGSDGSTGSALGEALQAARAGGDERALSIVRRELHRSDPNHRAATRALWDAVL
jgi:tetratricopeptide (TPR) repeat protein